MSKILLNNLLGASESKTQMVVPHGTVSATVLVTPLVTPCSWRSLRAPGVSSAPVEFVVSGLLWSRLPAQICFCKCPWSASAPADGLAKVSGSDLLPRRSQTQVHWNLQRTWLRPTPSEVQDS